MEEWIPLDLSLFRLSLPLSLSLRFPACIPLLHGSARPVLPWQQGLVRHGEDYRGRKERKRGKGPPAVPPQQQKPWGNLAGETTRQEFIPNFLSHTNVFVLQHQLACPPVSSSLISILCSFILHPLFLLFFPLNTFFPVIFALPLFLLLLSSPS